MAELSHPAAQLERAHLKETLDIVQHEREIAAEERHVAEGELARARMYDPDSLPIREMLFARAQQTERNMTLAAKKPYFTRIDFTEKSGAENTYYIGKYGVLRSDTLDVEVIDWRAPVANLYYSGQIGPLKYAAPDGEVEGELTLKRQFGIENGTLLTIFDTDLVAQDAYLQSVLGSMTGDRLREIVTTIQAEQNYVIRYPLNRTLVVQGVAGSGKTTIALHRIAYLLYTYQEKLRPEHMVILAPNPLFLNYIAQVLPDLGVENVRQTTFMRLMDGWLDGALPQIDMTDRLERVYEMDADALDTFSRALKYKGSPAMEQRLQRWLDEFEDSFVPEDGLTFGPIQIYTGAELRKFLLEDEKPFPLKRRLDEFKKQLKLRATSAANSINKWYREECDRRIARLRDTVPDRSERAQRVEKLEASLAERIKQTKAQVNKYVKETIAAFPPMQPAVLYERFWRDQLENGARGDARLAAEHTLTRMDAHLPLESEDIAPIAMIAMRTLELKRQDIRHIVIDEAQDFSPLEISTLQKMARGSSFTIVGDLMQGISGYRGLSDWRELTEDVFNSRATRHDLVTSYRNTIEIMEMAIRVMRNHPMPGQAEAKPVLRHGDAPEIVAVQDEAARLDAIRERISAWKAEGVGNIAVVARQRELLQRIQPALAAEFGAKLLDLNDDSYSGGVLLAPADSVKGLEFDGVILAGASEMDFPDRDLDSRLLYVCLTRALHKLAILHEGELTPLLKA